MTDPEISSIRAFTRTPLDINNPDGAAVINEAVARKLGWTLGNQSASGPLVGIYPHGSQMGSTLNHETVVPDFCHDIKAAMEIVRGCRRIMALVYRPKDTLTEQWECSFEDYPRPSTFSSTAAMAICLAFLKLP